MRVLPNLKKSVLFQSKLMAFLETCSLPPIDKIPFGPFNFFTQRRWKKPVVSAQTRLQDRVIDSKLDKLRFHLTKLQIILKIHELMSTRKRGPFVSVQLMSRWRNLLGLNVSIGAFIHKHPHIFEVFMHPVRRNVCCRMTREMKRLIQKEEAVVREWEIETVRRVKKLLMMSVNDSLHVHALRLIRKELGLPEDFRDSILGKYTSDFKLVSLEIVELVERDNELGVAEIEKWREREYREKWLSEFEIRFAFPINFPTGFKIERGYREKLKNWQRLPYLNPYERKGRIQIKAFGGIERFEKRTIAVLHQLLSLTVEKMVRIDQLAHFRKDLAIGVNLRELLLKHQGIFYISTKGKTQTVFLREAYSRGCLVDPDPIHLARRNMLNLVLLKCRNTKQLQASNETKESNDAPCTFDEGRKRDGDWVIPILES